MPVNARLKSLLKGVTEKTPETGRSQPCRVVHECLCGNPLVYALITPESETFGYKRGLPLELTWNTTPPKLTPGILNLFSRVRIASKTHWEFKCPQCAALSHVQLSFDGGMLPVGTMRMAYVIIPPEKASILKDLRHVEDLS